mmetsp:Transcript_8351/g.22629  ORF Transcript_8351/g.22629 Transcript_8351/m.22629 type:complete len:379 (-) Transcript_8351:21-1157(-)
MVQTVTTEQGETFYVSVPLVAPCGAMGAIGLDEASALQQKSKGAKSESKRAKDECSESQSTVDDKASVVTSQTDDSFQAEAPQTGALAGLSREEVDVVMAAMSAARSASSYKAVEARKDLRRLYELDGFVAPLHALGPEEVATALAGFKRFESEHLGKVCQGSAHYMNHVWMPWLRDLAMHPRILDAVTEIFCTQNVYLYNSQMLSRAPGKSQQTAMGVGWHKDADSHFCRLSPVDRRHWVTVFVALSMCDRDHGCLRARPTQRCGIVDPEIVDLELLPGEFSVHGPSTIHTGGLNCTADTRYCVALRYIRASTRDTHAEMLGRDMALLVSGSDKGNFDLIPEVPGEGCEAGRLIREKILRNRRMGPSSLSWQGMVCA